MLGIAFIERPMVLNKEKPTSIFHVDFFNPCR